MQKNLDALIGELELKLYVISFPLQRFSKEEIIAIETHLTGNLCGDDLTGKNGQITVDEIRSIIYTGSQTAADYIASGYNIRPQDSCNTVTVAKEMVTASMLHQILGVLHNRQKHNIPPSRETIATSPGTRNLLKALDAIGDEDGK